MYTITPALPAGTTIAPASCGNIASGGSCILTITPGATPNTPADKAPAPSVISVSGINTPTTVSSNIIVLTYGNRYQSGFVFDIDDCTNPATSVGGKVAALFDQADLFLGDIVWSSDAAGNPVNHVIAGINEEDTSPPDACNGATDGPCNTAQIVNFYSPPQSDTGVNLSLYAAGRCRENISGFADWYLPAMCEMGYGDGLGLCGSLESPTLQNMQSNLFDNGSGDFTIADYWSSTQAYPAPVPGVHAFGNSFDKAQLSRSPKSIPYSVRCVRQIT
jgi:hypothetical protein